MTIKYNSRKCKSFGMILLIAGIVVTGTSWILPLSINENLSILNYLTISLIDIFTISLFVWLWTGTYYLISEIQLIAAFGPLKWKVPIEAINLIRINQNTIGGMVKLTLSFKCIEIKYGHRNSIFISPDRQEQFIEELKKRNTNIEIK